MIINFEGKYFRFYGIHIAHIWKEYVVLLYLYDMYTKCGNNRMETMILRSNKKF